MLKKVLLTLRDVLISIFFVAIFMIAFFGAALQTSYRNCPPSEEEIAQMGLFEKFIYEPFKEEEQR